MTAFLLTGFHCRPPDELMWQLAAVGVPVVSWSPSRSNPFADLSRRVVEELKNYPSFYRALADHPEPFLALQVDDEDFAEKCHQRVRVGLSDATVAGALWSAEARRDTGAPIDPIDSHALWAWADPFALWTATVWARAIPDLHIIIAPEPDDQVTAALREEYEAKRALMEIDDANASPLPSGDAPYRDHFQQMRILDAGQRGYHGPRPIFTERFGSQDGIRSFLDLCHDTAEALSRQEDGCQVSLLSKTPDEEEYRLLLQSLGLSSRQAKPGTVRAGKRQNASSSREQDRDEILAAGLFDVAYYCAQVPHLRVSDVDPLNHFLTEGFRKYDPHPLFSTGWFLEQLSEVPETVAPVIHFLREQPLASPHPLFDSVWFKDNAEALGHPIGAVPLADFIRNPALQWISTHPLIDPQFYLASFPQLQACSLDIVRHWLSFGRARLARPHPVFMTEFYCSNMPQGGGLTDDPLIHYLRWGWRENLPPHVAFDPLVDLPAGDQDTPETARAWIAFLRRLPQSGLAATR